MKYCPRCDEEFQDSAERCRECECALISEQQWRARQVDQRQDADEVFVRVAVAGDRFEADVMKDALEQEQIPVLVRTFQDTSFDGIFINQKGWALIEVPTSSLPRARQIIDALAIAGSEE
jgi:hypothetical protein